MVPSLFQQLYPASYGTILYSLSEQLHHLTMKKATYVGILLDEKCLSHGCSKSVRHDVTIPLSFCWRPCVPVELFPSIYVCWMSSDI
uniref:Uncharacterized protein n=1 Tax=Arundo donax TaxID=35708 RepID=A0A0A9GSW1_ARUDO